MKINIWKILLRFWKNVFKLSKHKTISWSQAFLTNLKGLYTFKHLCYRSRLFWFFKSQYELFL